MKTSAQFPPFQEIEVYQKLYADRGKNVKEDDFRPYWKMPELRQGDVQRRRPDLITQEKVEPAQGQALETTRRCGRVVVGVGNRP